MSKSLNDYFDKIYCVHMEEGYEDRKVAIDEFATQMNCEIIISPGVNVNDIDIPSNITIKPTQLACSMAHVRLWLRILRDQPKRALIIEDDAVINRNVDVLAILDKYHDYAFNDSIDLTLLGTNYVSARTTRIDDHIHRLHVGYCTHAYSPSMKYLKWMLNHKINLDSLHVNPNQIIDNTLVSTMSNHNCIVFNPPLVCQKAGFSIIDNAHNDFSKELIR